jgi:phosphoribosylanthranilate isomerase
VTKVKICGLSRAEDIIWVNAAQPDFIGFVFAESHRQVTVEQARKLRGLLSPAISAVGVFRNTDPDSILQVANQRIIDIIQLHGNEDENYLQYIRKKAGGPIIKAISVTGPEDIELWQNSTADYLLLDHGAGGTGQTFDWRQIGKSVKPFFLAGGLHAGNIRQAIEQNQPFAVDISSGVETGGRKDPEKIHDIIRRIRNA